MRGAAVAQWSRYRITAGMSVSSSPVPLKIRRVGERCTLNLSRAQTSDPTCRSFSEARLRGYIGRVRSEHITFPGLSGHSEIHRDLSGHFFPSILEQIKGADQ
ncbi:hypothetical protein TNCV_2777491 [Trichonephila clavipes]|nr:hypothetical protein TNCV_2777491 [Trichonephila clavipes]